MFVNKKNYLDKQLLFTFITIIKLLTIQSREVWQIRSSISTGLSTNAVKESLIKLITFMVRQACMVFLAPS